MPDRGPRRHSLRICLIAVVALAAALLPAASAWGAKVVYPSQTAQFGADGTDSTTFGGTSQMTFNQASHRLYALGNSGGTKIFGFDVSTPGTYTPLGAGDGFPISVASPGIPGLSTDNSPGSAGNIYYVSENSGSLYGFTSAGVGLSGFPVSGFGDPCGGATDGEGNTWVGDYGAQRIKEYSSAGASLGSVDVSRTGSPCAVGIDGG
ncbi:MAG TPA: hypothetical protein VGF04_07340, partial [Solirubrobacterales bacterium]